MLLFGHQAHVYEVRRLCRYQISPGAITEVPDEIGQALLAAHPGKVCDVSAEALPEAHVCSKSAGYQHEEITEAPEDRMMRPDSDSRVSHSVSRARAKAAVDAQ